jgi:glutathione S-transferase
VVGDAASAAKQTFPSAGPIEAAVTNKSLGFEVKPEGERMAGYGNFATVMDAMETAVSDMAYVAGDAFSAADVYFGSQIGWGLRFGSIEPRPAFQVDWDRISSRPAAVRANEIDDALISA